MKKLLIISTLLCVLCSCGSGNSQKDSHEWVDLGLPSGVKWATCNVGASTPNAYGNYYAWGETTTKDFYTEGSCASYDQPWSNISGHLQRDAATYNWGSQWRMPTAEECCELRALCTWEWIYQNGYKGYKITGPNGRSIFLPAAGYRDNGMLYVIAAL